MNILSSLQHKVRKELTLHKSIVLGGLLFAMVFSSAANALNITVSIPPLAGMIKPLLSDDDHIEVLLKPGASPHGFQLKPSNIKTLKESDLVLWVGTPVDHWMKKPLQNITVPKQSLLSVPDVEQLAIRQGGLWERKKHHHDEDEDEHEHEHEHEHESSHNSEMSQMDGHIWMSFNNAQSFIKVVSDQLQLLKPQQAKIIQQKTQDWLLQLAMVDLKIQSQLTPVKDVPYMVLHDAFHYFSNRYNLNGIGSIQLNPTISPSLKRVAELREKIKQGDVRCVFKEPQFPAKRVYAVTKNLKVKVGSLDPIGLVSKEYQQKNSADYLPYDVFLEQLSNQFYDCLSQTK
ncbi:zinc ABC transporter substrate-binding protein [Thiomicrorhabdus sp.]|uniref:zinc ABC transporter substrate-binding protein n=1 Tax=Thiomicrorhabdus sp. TaxID=2039724 RepID=UPI002AA7B19B|nr:zinc ABC transporter substrate-binding protein [Thiomicrorhabdus sp.]